MPRPEQCDQRIVNVLEQDYGVDEILGMPYGYKGLTESSLHEPIEAQFVGVDQIHKQARPFLDHQGEIRIPTRWSTPPK